MLHALCICISVPVWIYWKPQRRPAHALYGSAQSDPQLKPKSRLDSPRYHQHCIPGKKCTIRPLAQRSGRQRTWPVRPVGHNIVKPTESTQSRRRRFTVGMSSLISARGRSRRPRGPPFQGSRWLLHKFNLISTRSSDSSKSPPLIERWFDPFRQFCRRSNCTSVR